MRNQREPIEIGGFRCYSCDSLLDTLVEDARGEALPYCKLCKYFYQPTWQLRGVTYVIQFIRRDPIATHSEPNEMPQQQPQDDPEPSFEQSPRAPEHKRIRQQILNLLAAADTPMRAGEIAQRIDAARQSVSSELTKMATAGEILKIKRGVYQRIP